MRNEFSRKVKVQAFERANGRCEVCTAKLHVGKFHYDHIIPDAVDGGNDLSNCQVACVACHGIKTDTKDKPEIAKTKAIRDKHINAMPKKRGFRGHRKFDGSIVWKNN